MTLQSAASVALERAEFDAAETAVRYHEGTASAAELAVALGRLRALRARIARERAALELFAFPRRAASPGVTAGH